MVTLIERLHQSIARSSIGSLYLGVVYVGSAGNIDRPAAKVVAVRNPANRAIMVRGSPCAGDPAPLRAEARHRGQIEALSGVWGALRRRQIEQRSARQCGANAEVGRLLGAS